MSDSAQCSSLPPSLSPTSSSPISNDATSDLSSSTLDHKPSYTTSYVPFTSPPTPSPSPSPRPAKSHCPDRHELALLRDVRPQFGALSAHAKNVFLSELLSSCSVETLVHICNIITPRIKRDFLRDLPPEIALHIISFITDARTLSRAGAVSKYWRTLMADEFLWRTMCKEHKYCSDRITGSRASASRGICGSPRARVVRRLSIADHDAEEMDSDVRSGFNLAAATSASLSLSDSESSTTHGEHDDDEDGEHEAANDMVLDFTDERAVLDAEAREQNDMSLPLPGRRALLRDFAANGSLPTGAPGSILPLRLPSTVNGLSSGRRSRNAARQPTLIRNPTVPFSYKQHFKVSYLTEANWRQAGRIVRMHTFSSGTVTNVSMDSEWIIASLTNTKIYVFSARTGAHVRNLVGHNQGVWALHLVSKGGEPEGSPNAAKFSEDVDEDEEDDDEREYYTPPDHIGSSREGSGYATPQPQGASTFGQGLGLGLGFGGIGMGMGGPSPSIDTTTLHPNPPGSIAYPHFSPPVSPDPSHTLRSSTSNSNATSNTNAFPHPLSLSTSALPSSTNSAFPSTSTPISAAPLSASASTSFRPTSALRGSNGKNKKSQQQNKKKANNELPPLPKGLHAKQSDVCNASYGWGQEGALALSGSCDRELRVWDVRSGFCIHILRGHTSTIRCVKALDGRPVAVSASRDGVARVWDIQKGICLRVLEGHTGSVRSLDVAGNVCVTASYDTTARMWNVDTGECLRIFRGHQQQIYSVAFDGLRVATGSLDSTVRLWDAASGECLTLLQGHTSLVGNVQILDDDLVTGGSDGRVIVFSLKNYTTRLRICAHDNSVTTLQADAHYLVTGGNDGCVKLFDRATGALVRELTEPCSGVWKVLMRRDKCVIMCKRGGSTVVEVLGFAPTAEQLCAS